MTVRIGVNGFGRIGRLVVRAARDRDIEVVGVNDVVDVAMLAHLLKYDSTFGRYPGSVAVDGDALVVDGRRIRATAERDPADLDWSAVGADIVVESTGRFRSREDAARHLKAGAHKVVLSAPGKSVDATIVLGVNADEYDPALHDVVSNASCTTNCFAPMVKVLHEAFGLRKGFLTTVHGYTNDQNVLDGPHKDLHRARAAAVNLIPTTTGAARAVGLVLPELAGRLDGIALRVPLEDGSLCDFACGAGPGRDRGRGERRVQGGSGRRAGRAARLQRGPHRVPRRGRRAGVLHLRRDADPGAGRPGEGLRLVRQRVGLHPPAAGPGRARRRPGLVIGMTAVAPARQTPGLAPDRFVFATSIDLATGSASARPRWRASGHPPCPGMALSEGSW